MTNKIFLKSTSKLHNAFSLFSRFSQHYIVWTGHVGFFLGYDILHRSLCLVIPTKILNYNRTLYLLILDLAQFYGYSL